MSVFKRNSVGDLDRGDDGRGFSRVVKQEEARVWLETVLRIAQGEVQRDTRVGLDHEYLFDPLVPNNQKANHIAAVSGGIPGITDAQVGFNFNGETGVLDTTMEVAYDEADQEGRTSKVENFLIAEGADVGGSNE